MLAVFYGCGVGVALVSYLARGCSIQFTRYPPFKGSVTVIDALGYPKQQDIFWYVMGLTLPLLFGLLYGLAERARGNWGERAWWLSLAIFLVQSPLIALSAWPGASLAIMHLTILCLCPVALGFVLKSGDTIPNSAAELVLCPRISLLSGEDRYRPSAWLAPILLLLFAGFATDTFVTLSDFSITRMIISSILWSAIIAVPYIILFGLLSLKFPLPNISLGDRLGWGLMPVVVFPLYQLVWGNAYLFRIMILFIFIVGALLFIFPPGKEAGRTALILLSVAIAAIIHISPQYRYGYIDYLHEGQHLAFSQCVLRGMLPGVEKAVKYGPLFELSMGWAMKLFGAQISVFRMYFILAQVLGYFFEYLLLIELVRRRWIVVYSWLDYLVFSFTIIYNPAVVNNMRIALPILAIYFWSRRCRGGGAGWLIGTGVAGATAAIYSVEFGLAGVVALIAGLISRGFGEGFKSGIRLVAHEALIMAAGSLIVAIPFAVLYVAHGGLLSLISGMYEYAEGFRLGYGAFPFPAFPWLDDRTLRILGFFYFLKRLIFYLTPLTVIACGGWLTGIFVSRKWKPEHAAITALVVYAMVVFRSSMGRSDYFHLILALAPSAILALVLADRIWGAIKSEIALARSFTFPALPILCLTFSALMLFPFVFYKSKYGMYGTYKAFVAHHLQKDIGSIEAVCSQSGYKPLDLERARGIWVSEKDKAFFEETTRFILNNTGRDEELHIAPIFGILFFFADRVPLTRYCMTVDAVTYETRNQILQQLIAKKPRMILISKTLAMDLPYNEEHPEEVKYIEEYYISTKKFTYLDVYLRKEDSKNEH